MRSAITTASTLRRDCDAGKKSFCVPVREARWIVTVRRCAKAMQAALAASYSLKMAGPGVVPRHSNIKNLDCQMALRTIMGAKGFLLRCKIVTAACIASIS